LGIAKRLMHCRPEEISVCSVVKAELFYGAAKSKHPEQSRLVQEQFLAPFHSFSFDDSAAIVYGNIRARLASIGSIIGPNDLMIASIALAHDLILVTANIREFSRVPSLRYENWEEQPL
jgi:tRNA(fMet)-specific endonuclease VapC